MPAGIRTLIVSDRAHRAHCARRAARVRARPLDTYFVIAAEVNDSPALMSIHAAPEWQELSDDGKMWVTGLVRETIARAVEQLL